VLHKCNAEGRGNRFFTSLGAFLREGQSPLAPCPFMIYICTIKKHVVCFTLSFKKQHETQGRNMGNKTKFTASEAIEAIDGMHRKRFYQMVNNGDLSYTTEQQGSKQTKVFDASELVRVFGDKLRIEETPETKQETQKTSLTKQYETSGNTLGNKLLEQDVKHLHERLADREAQLKEKDSLISDIRQERDDWKQQAQKLLLTHTPEPAIKTTEETPQPVKDRSGQGGAILTIVILFAIIIAILLQKQILALNF